ncbi:hypothetical protein Tco_0111291 [Tanacetum coccineum]
MTIFPEISRRARDMYHNLQDDDIMKNIFNSGRHKDKVGMQIPDWMITEEMKHTEHYMMQSVWIPDLLSRDQVPVYVAEGLILERQKTKEEMERMIAKAILQERGNIQAEISSQIQKAIDNQIPSQVDASVRSYMSGHILHVHPAQTQTLSVPEQQYQLYLSMKDNPQLQQQDIAIWLALQMKFENLQVPQTTCRPSAVRPRDQDDPHDDAHPEGENSAKLCVNKCVEKFNPYARYGVEHWKNPHAKIFYIRKQKEPGKPKEEVYLNSKIIHVIKTYWELAHEHKFITERVTKRANECIVSITEPDYKNLNKNDIEDMYLLIMNGKVPDYAETGLLWSLSVFIRSSVIWERVHDFQLGIESYQQKVNLTAPTISFPGVEKHKMFSIIYEPVHGIIYKNSKKEKRVMRHLEIHKFCDATLNRVLEGLKSYNNDVKYGYVQRELTNDEVEYLKLFEEEIKVRLKYRNQIRRWEMYVNGRPLGPQRERLE